MIQAEGTLEVYTHLTTLADTVRGRILRLLESHELPVSDLCDVLQLPQSTVSRHLRTLSNRGWVSSRPDGTRRLYRARVEGMDPVARDLWGLLRAQLEPSSACREDAFRLEGVLARARSRSQEFFARRGDQWDTLRDALFGPSCHLYALMGLLDAQAVCADLGCGTGRVTEAIAPFVRQVFAVDDSEPMLARAARRLARFDNVELRRGDVTALPLEDASLDVATSILVLHHLDDPARAITEAARCLRPGGRLLLADMLPHDREQYRQEMGHVWLGFSEEVVRGFLDTAGFEDVRFVHVPPSPQAKGPALFTASARRGG